jgi:hypothetical protein
MSRNIASTSAPRKFRSSSLIALFLLIPHTVCENTEITTNRPVIHVFFEPISQGQRFTSMTDQDDADLIHFWKQAWNQAGWEPRVLTLEHAKKHELYDEFHNELDKLCMDEFGKLSLLRWLALANTVEGGWMADYDAFALRGLPANNVLENNGQVTIYQAVAPVVVSGSASALTDVAKYLLDHAKSHGRASQGRLSFWTDTLGLLSAWRDPNCTLHVKKDVLDGRKALSGKTLSSEDCNKRPYRGKRFVHIGHFCMMEAPGIAPELRLPRYRLTVAKQWLSEWYDTCGGGNMTTLQ